METEFGWNLEFKLPLRGQPLNTRAGDKIGFEVQINDNDTGDRESVSKWWADNDEAWHAPEEFGTAVFTEREINEKDLGRVLPVPFTTYPIAIDGEADFGWTEISPIFANYRWKEPDSMATPMDAALCWRAAWDYENLYLWVRVTDDTLLYEGMESTWQDDGIEMYFDGDGDQSESWPGVDENFFRTNFMPDMIMSPIEQGKGVEMDSTDLMRIKQAQKLTPEGLVMEIAYPLDLLGIEAGDGTLFGLDIHYNDSDTPGLERDTKITTYDSTDGTWGNSDRMGLARLVGSQIQSDVKSEPVVVTSYELRQNYPNPFNPSTTIEFAIPQANMVKLTVYDILGREVVRLLDNRMDAGRHAVTFDASRLASGVYFYRLQTPDKVMHKKMMLLK